MKGSLRIVPNDVIPSLQESPMTYRSCGFSQFTARSDPKQSLPDSQAHVKFTVLYVRKQSYILTKTTIVICGGGLHVGFDRF